MDLIELDHPGLLLFEDFIEGSGLTKYKVAKATGIRATTLGEICAGKRSISPAVDLRLCLYFGLSSGYFLRLQVMYQTAQAERELGEQARKEVTPLEAETA